MRKYQLPIDLLTRVDQKVYERWLQRKAEAHVKRDRTRGNAGARVSEYKAAIHKAVCESRGVDAYTGEELDWSLLSKYDNDESKRLRGSYKKRFALLPSVDHCNDVSPDFKICSWRTNDAKNDLTYDEFVELCRKVLLAANK